MKVIITPCDESSLLIRDQLLDWSASGMLVPFAWWMGRRSGDEVDLTVQHVVGGEVIETSLAKALDGVAARDVDLVAFASTSLDGEFDPTFGDTIDRFELAAQDVIAFVADRPLTTSIVVAPADVGQAVPENYFLARRHARVLVASEDRTTPEEANHLIEEDDDSTPHGAHALASLCDLWSTSQSHGSSIFNDLYVEPRGSVVSPVRLARCYTRVVDLEDFPDRVAMGVFRVGEGWPNPDRKRFVRAIDPGPLLSNLTTQFLRKHEPTLGLSPFTPTPLAPPRRLSLWEAVKLILKLAVDFILHLPQRLMELLARRVADQVNRMAGMLETQLDKLGAGGYEVKRVGDEPGDTPSEFEHLSFAERSAERDPSATWWDLTNMSLAVIDGADLPDPEWNELMRFQEKRTIVEHPRVVVPDPTLPRPAGVHGFRADDPVRVCDPLFLEPRFMSPENPLSARYSGPQLSVSSADDSASSTSSEPASAEAAKSGETSTVKGLEGDPSESEVADGADASQEVQEEVLPKSSLDSPSDEDDDDLLRRRAEWMVKWVEPHVDTPVWKVGASLAAAYQTAVDEADLADQGPGSEVTRAELKEVDDRINEELKQAARGIRKRWMLGLPFLVLITLAVYFGALQNTPIYVRVPAMVLVLAAWVLLGALSIRRHTANVENLRREREAVHRNAIDRERKGILRRSDRERLQRRYAEYRDWAEVIGWFAHYPWLTNDDASDAPEPLPHNARPASFVVAGADIDNKLQQIVQRERHALFRTAWLGSYFKSVVEDVMGDYVKAYEYVEDEEFERPDPMADVTDQKESPRRYFVDATRDGAARHIDLEQGNSLSEDLLNHLGSLSLDQVVDGCETNETTPDGAPVRSRKWSTAAEFSREILGEKSQAFLPRHWVENSVSDAAVSTVGFSPQPPVDEQPLAESATELAFTRPLRCLYRRVEFSGVYPANSFTSVAGSEGMTHRIK